MTLKRKFIIFIYDLNQILNQIKPLKIFISNFYDKILLIQEKIKLKLIGENPHLYNIIYINPEIIVYHLKTENFSAERDKSIFKVRFVNPLFSLIFRNQIQIVGGDWDDIKRLKKVSETEHFISFNQHFINRLPWTSTEYYKTQLEDTSSKSSFFHTKNDVYLRFKNYDDLFDSIKRIGYKSQIELIKMFGSYDKLGRYSKIRKINDEISVAISRDGIPILFDGIHRVVIAKILNLKRIPVYINMIHSDYIKRKDNKE